MFCRTTATCLRLHPKLLSSHSTQNLCVGNQCMYKTHKRANATGCMLASLMKNCCVLYTGAATREQSSKVTMGAHFE